MRLKYNIIWFLMGILLPYTTGTNDRRVGDPCATKSVPGVFRLVSQCPELKINSDSRVNIENEDIVCCPNSISNTSSSAVPKPKERAAVIACREIEANLKPHLVPHIKNEQQAELGEYPHVAAIGYSEFENNSGPYSFRCGGSLIAKKFVLTAAHCVKNTGKQPVIVRLGVVNLNEIEHSDVQEIRIKAIHVHENFLSGQIYNDIAILELESDVGFNNRVYPACLYTDLVDPPQNYSLYMTGWGVKNMQNGERSDVLSNTKMNIVSLSECNEHFKSVIRRIPSGILNTQLCAHTSNQTTGTFNGNGGGPLNLVLNANIHNYRIVGIVSAGYGYGSEAPDVYTRVASYLNFIEAIVWPDLH